MQKSAQNTVTFSSSDMKLYKQEQLRRWADISKSCPLRVRYQDFDSEGFICGMTCQGCRYESCFARFCARMDMLYGRPKA